MYVDFSQAAATGVVLARSAPLQATSDEALMARIAAGDRDAMRALYVRHHMRVHRFVLRLVRNQTVAEAVLDRSRRRWMAWPRRCTPVCNLSGGTFEKFRRIVLVPLPSAWNPWPGTNATFSSMASSNSSRVSMSGGSSAHTNRPPAGRV